MRHYKCEIRWWSVVTIGLVISLGLSLSCLQGQKPPKNNKTDETDPSFSTTSTKMGTSSGDLESVALADLDKDGDLDGVGVDAGGLIYIWKNNGSPFSNNWPRLIVNATSLSTKINKLLIYSLMLCLIF